MPSSHSWGLAAWHPNNVFRLKSMQVRHIDTEECCAALWFLCGELRVILLKVTVLES